MKPVIPRQKARRDVDAAVAYYLDADEPDVAREFIAALQRAYEHLSRFPASGSPRYAVELGLPGLRCWPVSPFRYLIFYIDGADAVDVWAVLHERRDIPDALEELPPLTPG